MESVESIRQWLLFPTTQSAMLETARPNCAGGTVGSQIAATSQRNYCLLVVVEKAPGATLPINELPWNESIVPPFGLRPVLLLAIIESETRMESPALDRR